MPITFHLFPAFCVSYFPSFFIFLVASCILGVCFFPPFTLFHYFFGVIYVPYFLPFLDVFCVSYASPCFDCFPSFGVIFVAFIFSFFLFSVSGSYPCFIIEVLVTCGISVSRCCHRFMRQSSPVLCAPRAEYGSGCFVFP